MGTSGWSGSTRVTETSGRPDVAHLLEQAVQRGLVGDRAVDDGGAVALVGEGQPVEPGGPSGVEVPLEADLVPSGLVTVVGHRSSGRPCAGLAGVATSSRDPEARSGCGERASPHVVIRGGERRPAGDRSVRSGRSVVAVAPAGRAPRPGGPLPGGCSRRAWRRCSWCASARCSGTRRARGRCPGRRGRSPSSRSTSSSRSLSGSTSAWSGAALGPRPGRRRPAVDGRSPARCRCFAAASSRAAIGGALVDEDADVALRLGQRQGALQRRERGGGCRRAPGGRAPAAPGSR